MKPMTKEPILQKFMRPRNYAKRVDVNWRSIYSYLDDGLIPKYKFAGVVLIDVEEADAILKSMPAPLSAAALKRRAMKEHAK